MCYIECLLNLCIVRCSTPDWHNIYVQIVFCFQMDVSSIVDFLKSRGLDDEALAKIENDQVKYLVTKYIYILHICGENIRKGTKSEKKYVLTFHLAILLHVISILILLQLKTEVFMKYHLIAESPLKYM